nr:amidohydrolase family protein [Clostridia bacterium]
MPDTLKLKNAAVYNTSVHKFMRGSITVNGGIITEISYEASESGEGIDLGGMYVLPGMVDIHTHGRAGCDFPKLSPEELDTVRRSYALAGTTTFMATIGSCPLEDAYGLISLLRSTPDKAGLACIGGMHFEGRYLSPKRKGAHHPSLLAPLDAEEIKAQLDYAHSEKEGEKPLVTHVTAAPELEGGREFIEAVISTGATFSVGHSDATYEEAMNAVNWGAVGFSHFFHCMSPIHHRETGCVGAGLLSDAYTELICDV